MQAAARPRRPRTASSRRHKNVPTSRPDVRRQAASALDRALTAAAQVAEPTGQTFADLGLPAVIVAELRRQRIEVPFAIQARALPDALAGRDVLGRAQTGSGKTLAFGLPVLAGLAGADSRPEGPPSPRALVLVPTRELAQQVADALTPLAKVLRLRVATVYGGVPIGRQIDTVRRGVDLVVATPGRLIDLMERGVCPLDRIEATVLDEADHMADLGFLPAVTRILDATPSGCQRMLFSATLDRGVDRLVHAYLDDPAIHAVGDVRASVTTADHRVFVLPSEDKLGVAAVIAGRPARTLFFVRTKHGADRLARKLSRMGADAAAIHGNLNQRQRQRALDGFAHGHPRVLVATDVAARGIHVDDVDLVVHYDPPNDHKDYLHRSGRTARGGASGTVVALVEPTEVRGMRKLHEAAGVKATSHTVGTGHDSVRELATSGTPVVSLPVRRAEPDGVERPRRQRPRGKRRVPRGGRHATTQGSHVRRRVDGVPTSSPRA